MQRLIRVSPLLALLVLGACATLPNGPGVLHCLCDAIDLQLLGEQDSA